MKPMKTRFALLLAVGILAGGCLPTVTSQEPKVDGKPLSAWLKEYSESLRGGGEGRESRRERSAAAVRQLGTNAIPWLVQMLREKNETRNEQADCGYEILGADAKEAVSDLVDIYERSPCLFSKARAADALADIGPAANIAVPSLLRGITNSDAGIRLFTINALGAIHSRSEEVVPALMKSLGDSNRSVRAFAAMGLGKYGAEANEAKAALLQLSNDPDKMVQSAANIAIERISHPTGE